MKKIKQEVKDLCLEFRKEKIGTEYWKELEKTLKNKWGFTSYNLLALFCNPPTIEYNNENISLVNNTKEMK